MAKVLISFIGTGSTGDNKAPKHEYRPAQYQFGEHKEETTFVSIAMKKFLAVDKIFLLGTIKSMWEEVYRTFQEYNKQSIDEDYYWRLAYQIEEAGHDSPIDDALDLGGVEQAMGHGSRAFLLKYGLNDDELEINFQQLLYMAHELEDGDEIFLDFTHSFRSHGLFLQTAMSYITDVLNKNIRIGGMYYGMLEATKDLGHAPIIDLTENHRMHQMIKAAHEFQTTGRGDTLASLIENKNKDLANKFKEFSNARGMNLFMDFSDKIKKMEEMLDRDQGSGLNNSELSLSRTVVETLDKEFCQEDSLVLRNINLAKGLFEKKQYGFACMWAYETLINFVCEKYGLGCGDDNFEKSMEANKEAKRILHDRQECRELSVYFKKLRELRNTIAHPSMDAETKINENVKNLGRIISDLSEVFKQFS